MSIWTIQKTTKIVFKYENKWIEVENKHIGLPVIISRHARQKVEGGEAIKHAIWSASGIEKHALEIKYLALG